MEVDNSNQVDQATNKKGRKRRKKLLNSIMKQIEFYLSDANLRKDRYLRQLMKEAGEEDTGLACVPLTEFLNFNKIKSFTNKVEDIQMALAQSELLELNEDKSAVKRKFPIDNSKDTDLCTIYVENLPHHADHNWIRSTFEPYGEIVYVSLPRFAKSGKIKGFAFIEFEKPESVLKACEHFGASIPDTLLKKLNLNGDNNDAVSMDEIPESIKRGLDDSDEEENDHCSKRLKHESPKHDDIGSESQPVDETGNDLDVGKVQDHKKKKLRRKERKQTDTESIIEDEKVINLRVMSKYEWLDYKQKYVKLQKETMSKIKKSMLMAPTSINIEDSHSGDGDNVMTTDEGNKTDVQKLTRESKVVLKLVFEVPSSENFEESLLRKKVRELAGENLAYIDVDNRVEFIKEKCRRFIFLRYKTQDDAQKQLKNEKLLELASEVLLLSGEEEDQYWQRVEECMQRKREQKEAKKAKGRTKLIQKAENVFNAIGEKKVNTHIKFE